MWSSLVERFRNPVERARWRVEAFESLLKEHRTAYDHRTDEEWAHDDRELAVMAAEAKWNLELLESAISQERGRPGKIPDGAGRQREPQRPSSAKPLG